jgi:DNA invertase Pin-like site-specific DNA recombinase
MGEFADLAIQKWSSSFEGTEPMSKPIRVAFYVRVSTGEQTVENQLRELEEVAAHRGWQIAATFEDAGISGAKGRDKRPGLDKLLKAVTRGQFDLVAAWSVDRLGRSLPDLLAVLGEIRAAGADLYLHKQAIDTSTPAGKAMFQMMGVFAEFERAIIVERVNAGLARARAQGKTLGRKRNDDKRRVDQVKRLRSEGMGILRIAKTIGAGTRYVQRILAESRA